jgi:hypothetical protein
MQGVGGAGRHRPGWHSKHSQSISTCCTCVWRSGATILRHVTFLYPCREWVVLGGTGQVGNIRPAKASQHVTHAHDALMPPFPVVLCPFYPRREWVVLGGTGQVGNASPAKASQHVPHACDGLMRPFSDMLHSNACLDYMCFAHVTFPSIHAGSGWCWVARARLATPVQPCHWLMQTR